jgi:hypothetical protein
VVFSWILVEDEQLTTNDHQPTVVQPTLDEDVKKPKACIKLIIIVFHTKHNKV